MNWIKLWEKNLEELSNATEIISKELRDAGYTKVKFNFAYCDLEKGQEQILQEAQSYGITIIKENNEYRYDNERS